jgi:pimeloyl-ACP methyl ester carboxylesterase
MMLIPYWSVLETVGIILIFAFMLLWLWRSAKRNQANPRVPPTTLGGRVIFVFRYILRIVGMGLVAFLLISVFVIVDRNLYSLITETVPAPSEVSIPPDLSFEVEEVTFAGGEGLKMAGWKVPSKNGATVILLHGYGGNRTMMLWHAEQLVKAGYGVLMYDERASGESEGTRRSYGWEDPSDTQGAVRFIKDASGDKPEQVGIAGCSIGAQISLQSAAYSPEIEAVWADGASSVRARDLPPPDSLIMAMMIFGNYTLDGAYEWKLDLDAPPAMIEIIGNIAPRPIMLVGGGQPHWWIGSEGETMVPRYAHYAGSNAQTWVIPEATHCDGPIQRPEEYAERMVEFFDTAFGIER